MKLLPQKWISSKVHSRIVLNLEKMAQKSEKFNNKFWDESSKFSLALEQFLLQFDRLDAAHRGINTQLIPAWLKAGLSLSSLIEDSGYGETPTKVLRSIFERLQFEPGDVFLDLGCGLNSIAGRLSQTGIESHGIERNPSLYDLAQRLSDFAESKATTLVGDFLSLDWPPANKLYSATQRMCDATLSEMAEKILEHKPVQIVGCLGKSLPGLEKRLISTTVHRVQWNSNEEFLETQLYIYEF